MPGDMERKAMRRRITPTLLLWYALIGFLILGYILTPFFHTVRSALQTDSGFGLGNFHAFFSNPNQRRVAGNTILLGISMVLSCGTLGTALALYMTFLAGRGKRALHILLLSPMMIPGVITVISFIQLYGESGLVTKPLQMLLRLQHAPYSFEGFWAIIFVITFTQYVYFYLNIYVALKYIDGAAVETARSFGASPIRVFRDVIWPVIRPAALTSSVLTFASGVSSFSAPNLMGGGFKVLSTQIVRSKANNHLEMASVQAIILFVISVTVLLLVHWYSRRFGSVGGDRNAVPVTGSVKGGAFSAFCRIMIAVQIVLILLPVAAILYLSFVRTGSIMQDLFPHSFTMENYRTIFQKRRVLAPLLNSIRMSGIAVAAGLVLTVPSAYLTVRRAGRMDRAVRFCLNLPSAMPASLLAINLINSFVRGTVFSFGKALIGGFAIVPIAYTIAALPLLLSSNEAAIRGMQRNLEETSRSLGAGTGFTALHVILPNIMPGMIAGGILVFIRTIGEYTMSALLYGVHNRPVSISIITNMQEYQIGISLAYGTIVILICCISLFLVFRLDRKRFF